MPPLIITGHFCFGLLVGRTVPMTLVLVIFILTTQIQTKNKPAGIFWNSAGSQNYFPAKILFLKINLDITESIKLYFVSIKAIKI